MARKGSRRVASGGRHGHSGSAARARGAAQSRPPWAFLARVELAKSHIDEQKVDDAVTILEALGPAAERLLLLSVWRLEAVGQLYRAVRKDDDARGAFAAAERRAQEIGLTRRADVLRQYLG